MEEILNGLLSILGHEKTANFVRELYNYDLLIGQAKSDSEIMQPSYNFYKDTIGMFGDERFCSVCKGEGGADQDGILGFIIFSVMRMDRREGILKLALPLSSIIDLSQAKRVYEVGKNYRGFDSRGFEERIGKLVYVDEKTKEAFIRTENDVCPCNIFSLSETSL